MNGYRISLSLSLSNIAISPSPEDIFHYIYAVLHSPTYRSRYAELLKIDFPRIPLPGSLPLFRDLAAFGGELVALHLLESPKLDTPVTRFVGDPKTAIGRVAHCDGTVWIDAPAKPRGAFTRRVRPVSAASPRRSGTSTSAATRSARSG